MIINYYQQQQQKVGALAFKVTEPAKVFSFGESEALKRGHHTPHNIGKKMWDFLTETLTD